MKLAVPLLLLISCFSVVPDCRCQNVANSPKSEQQPPQTATVERQPEANPEERPSNKDVQAADEQYRAVVGEMPPKDLWDKVYVVLTACLVAVGIITFLAVRKQAIETAAATKEMRNSVQLQKASLRQWIELRNWSSSSATLGDGEVASCDVFYSIINPTKFPLTLRNVITKPGVRPPLEMPLPWFLEPDGALQIKTVIYVENASAKDTRGVRFPEVTVSFTVTVEYDDVMGVRQPPQRFVQLCVISPDGSKFLRMPGDVQEMKKYQNPN